MTVSLRLSNEDTELFRTYAEMHNITLSDLFRNAVLEKIEDELDLKCYEEAMKEYKKDNKTYSLEEVKSELGL